MLVDPRFTLNQGKLLSVKIAQSHQNWKLTLRLSVLRIRKLEPREVRRLPKMTLCDAELGSKLVDNL